VGSAKSAKLTHKAPATPRSGSSRPTLQRSSAPPDKVEKNAMPVASSGKASSAEQSGSPSSSQKTKRGNARTQDEGLPEGIDQQSTFPALYIAIDTLKKQLQTTLPREEQWRLADQLEHVQDLVTRRKELVKQTEQTRRKNKAAERLKRMGGPLPRAPLKSPRSTPKK
jgi:hypothetical protein